MGLDRLRRPAVAGYFYPAEPERLREELTRLIPSDRPAQLVLAAIVPHAGYQYSGAIAGETFASMVIPRRCVILAPNHTGWGAPWSLMTGGAYLTPLGEVPIDASLARALLDSCPLLEPEGLAHRGEHAIEVELPFLQWRGPRDLAIVPLVVGSDAPEEFFEMGEAIATVIRQLPEPTLLLASSDFTHYEPEELVTAKDAKVLEAILALDEERMLRIVREEGITMCGFGPVATLLRAAKRLGATSARLIRHGTSAEAGGDPHSAVGYAGVLIQPAPHAASSR